MDENKPPRPCPECGAPLTISEPYGPTIWFEDCAACGFEGGGTAYFDPEEWRKKQASDDPPSNT